MTFSLSITRISVARRTQLFFWLHPEWWTVVLSGFAWAAMLFHGWRHTAHGGQHWVALPQELGNWLLMVAAMMLPLVLDSVREAAAGSLWARRHRAITGFLVGYFAPWLALGFLAAGSRQLSWTHTYIAPALSFAAAALWQLTPIHRRALVACHRRQPLAPLGWQADRDCLRFGVTIGLACISSCWPLMIACTLAGHGFIAMIGGMAVGAAERWSFRPRTRTALVGTLALAGYYALLASLH
jgi:predicted metal-binding membrane protein